MKPSDAHSGNAAEGSPPSWQVSSIPVSLTNDDIDVWRIALDIPDETTDRLRGILSEDERSRAARFRVPFHGKHFIRARSALRIVLGKYLGFPPESLVFHYGARGKPTLEGAELQFNLTHSGGLALCAVARDRAVGVDVEKIQPERPLDRLAKRFFAPGEIAALESLPPVARPRAFFECWTRKEAYIKARGEGLAIPLDKFEVSIGGAAALVRVESDPQELERWSLRALDVDEGYVATLAAEGHGWRVRQWQFTD